MDGHAFAKEVVEKRASVLVVSEDVEVGADVTVIKVADTRGTCLSGSSIF